MKVESEYFEEVKVEFGSMEGVVQKIDTVMTEIEGFDNKDQVTVIDYLEDKLNKFKKRNWTGNVKGIDCKTEVFQPFETIKKEVPETVDCSVNLIVKSRGIYSSNLKSCYPCDEIFLSWPDLKSHILVDHCKDKLYVYISGSEVAGYECEASHECSVKFKDIISILNHLSSKDHLIIEEKEIMDIALGIKSKYTNESKPDHSSYEDAIPLKSTSSIHQDTTENVKYCEGAKIVQKRQNAEKVKKRKNRESFEIFRSPLQIIKEPSPAKERKIDPPPEVANSQSKPAEIPIPKSTPMEVSSILEILLVKNQQCKMCAYDYISDNDLRVHLLEKHAGNFKTVPMLEAGKKYYECHHCIKKTKVREFHIKHLKKEHKIITLDLIKSEEMWKQGTIGYVDVCIERDDSMDCMLQPRGWESKPEELETSSHGKFHSRSDKSPVRRS